MGTWVGVYDRNLNQLTTLPEHQQYSSLGDTIIVYSGFILE